MILLSKVIDAHTARMRVLHVIAAMDPQKGGVAQAVRTIVGGLNLSGIDNEVLCMDDPNEDFLSLDNFKINAVGPGKGPWCYSPALLPWLNKNIERFDVIILHGLWLSPGYMIRKALLNQLTDVKNKRNSRKVAKLLIMPHGMLDPYFQKAEGRKIKALRNKIYWKLIEGKVVNMADGLLFTCEIESILARQSFTPYTPKRELIIGLGVDEPPAFIPAMQQAVDIEFPHLTGHPYILYLGRVHEKKGVDLLIEAYLKLAKQGAGKNDEFKLRLVIAGPGMDSPYGEKLRILLQDDEKFTGLVSFVGMVTGNNKWGLLYGCDAFVLPSHQENFGIAVVEALAIGKPVLISDQVNIWKEIKDANAGIIEPDTIQGTTSLLERWNSLSEEGKRLMGERAIGCYKNSFAKEPVVEKLAEALHNI